MEQISFIATNDTEPYFYVNFYKIARPNAEPKGEFDPKINKTKAVFRWRIHEQELIERQEENVGIFFDEETYIIQWLFELRIYNSIVEEKLVYFWRGQNAQTSYSPLSPEIEEDCPVERVCQWSEPALFFHGFQRKFIVFTGRQTSFNCHISHLFLFRGEDINEIHLLEVPCKTASLRSQGSFFLIFPEVKCFFYWHGTYTTDVSRGNIRTCAPHIFLKSWQKSWSTFTCKETVEFKEPEDFFKAVNGVYCPSFEMNSKIYWTPRLLYLNTITGCFVATEVEYPLRKLDQISPFPFLQNHLYSATQPALFLLDDYYDIWLWKGYTNSDEDVIAIENEKKLAKEFVDKYCKEKEQILGTKVNVYNIMAYTEPDQFKNIFPIWID